MYSSRKLAFYTFLLALTLALVNDLAPRIHQISPGLHKRQNIDINQNIASTCLFPPCSTNTDRQECRLISTPVYEVVDDLDSAVASSTHEEGNRVEAKEAFSFVVRPFLQYATQSSMTVVWQTNFPAKSSVRWGNDVNCENVAEAEANGNIYTCKITGLNEDSQYFYRVVSTLEGGESVDSEPLTFQTACGRGMPIAFAVISDTQKNIKVAGALAQLAWAQRPHFLLHPGDLVDKGKKDSDWLEEFFPSMNALISRVPMFSVLIRN